MKKKFFYMKDKIKSKKERKSRKEEKINLNEILKDESYKLGTFRRNGRGFGFVNVGEEDEIFISPKLTKNALDGDEVLIRIFDDSEFQDDKHKREGKILQITKHAQDTIVGVYKKSRNFGFVIPDDQAVSGDIYIPKKKSANAKNNQKVVVKIDKYSDGANKAEGTIVEIIGGIDEAGVDMMSLIKEYKLPNEFPENVLAEARAIPQVIDEKNIEKRVDLRNEEIFTIDGEDAKDLDDAVNVKKNDDGTYTLGVHIADVSYYVKSGSKLDKEAITRGTSIYMMDRVIPMLPKELSNGICSLNEQKDRFAISVIMKINEKGKVVDADIFKSVIKTTRRMNYHDVNDIFKFADMKDGKTELADEELARVNSVAEKYKEFIPHFLRMRELKNVLKQRRDLNGSLNLDIPESKIILNENGIAVDIQKYDYLESNEVIEQFMLTANESVAEKFYWLQAPFIYRVHDVPDIEKVNDLNKFLFNLGYKIRGVKKDDEDSIHPKAFAQVLEEVKGKPEERVVSNLILRTLKVAKYESENRGHFGIASKCYCHFTSPIRRYPDLLLHRLLHTYLFENKMDISTINYYENCLPGMAENCSQREQAAVDAEREVDDMKMAEYMEEHIGEIYEGYISGVTNFGFFVELPNMIEGLVHINTLEGDYYNYLPELMALIGERHKKIYRLGSKVRVKVVGASKESKTIDFILLEDDQNGNQKPQSEI